MEATIEIKCKACGLIRDVTRTNEIPKKVWRLGCNWCPVCEDKNANDYWREWYVYKRKDKGEIKAIKDNQIKLL